MGSQSIRPIAIGIISNGDKILVGKGHDKIKNETFYRPLGGGIKFGERGAECVMRELLEEISAEVTDFNFLGVLQNIFSHNGSQGHEIVLVYQCHLLDDSLNQMDTIPLDGKEDWLEVAWKPLEDFRTGKALLYPSGLLDLLHDTM